MGEPQLNIKDADVTAMVRELTALTGESQTEAVRKALLERLEKYRQAEPVSANEMSKGLKELARQGEANKLPGATSDHSFLYDKDGAPV